MSDLAALLQIPYGAVDAPGHLARFKELTAHHARQNPSYKAVTEQLFGNAACEARSLEDIPFLTASLFKHAELASVPPEAVFKTLTSSGTSGVASRILLDRETAQRQSQALTAIMGYWLGKQRLPMLLIDNQEQLQDRTRFNARAAATIGFSFFGRDHTYLLDQELHPRWDILETFLAAHGQERVFLFGFTFLVWQRLVEAARRDGIRVRFHDATLLHGGGWKKLADQEVSREAFNAALKERFNIDRVINYYGMVEQVGSIFVSCEEGYFHAPAFADVLIRDPLTLKPMPYGAVGAVQTLSLLPTSYPGHSLLTEDKGTLMGRDDCPCGRAGAYFTVEGRFPAVELKGCSDTRSVGAG